jgi:peptide/nickel transport system permease protein
MYWRRKIGQSLLVLLGVVTLVFILFFVVMPADPARLTLGQRSDATTLANTRKELYLDQPLAKQFVLYLNDLMPLAIHDNMEEAAEKYNYVRVFNVSRTQALVVKAPYLRRSYQSKKAVNALIAESFPGTLLLAGLAMLVATVLGIALGTIAAWKQNTWVDTSAILGSVLGISAPSFFAGILIAYVFGFLLHDITGLSIISPLWEYDPFTGKHLVWKSLILPVFTLAVRPLAIIVQITRSSLLDVMKMDFMRTAKAKGLNEKQVILRHGLRNALNPVITSVSGWLAELLAGSFFIEYIFGWKGLGKLTVDALNKFDFPVVMGSVLFTACLFIIINLGVDVLYRKVDPRIKLH